MVTNCLFHSGYLLKEYLHTAYTNTHKPKHQSVFERHFCGTEEEHVGGMLKNESWGSV